MKRCYLYLLLILLALPSWGRVGDDFTYIDWGELPLDSVMPLYTEVVPLETDYRSHDYTVLLEYPEWQEMTAAEVSQLSRLPSFGIIGPAIEVDTHVGVSRGEGLLDIAFVPIVHRDGHYQKLLSARITIEARPRIAPRLAKHLTQERYARSSRLAEGTWVKISVPEDGMYRLTRSALKKMGFTQPDNVHLYGYGGHRLSEVMSPDAYYDDLEEVPLYRANADTWLFWGNGVVHWEGDTRVFNPYASSGCYFLTQEEGPSNIERIPSLTASPQNSYTTYVAHSLHEKDEFAWFSGGRNLFEATNYATNNSHTYKLSAAKCVGKARLTVAFTANSDANTLVTPTVNGTPQGALVVPPVGKYQAAQSTTKTYDVTSCNVGTDWTVKLSSTAGHDARLDYLALHYESQIAPRKDLGYVAFSQSGQGITKFTVSDITPDVQVMRLGRPGNAPVLVGGILDESTYSIVVDDATCQYVAFLPDWSYPQPKVEGTIANQNLHALDSLDMVIIIPQSNKLMGQAQRLAQAHRDFDGLRVGIVRADEVYNEFSSGTPDATAYRLLMKMLYDRGEGKDNVAPRYLLLMGDCAWDNRMISQGWRTYNPADYLLCFESEDSFSDTKCYVMEDYFGLLDDGEGAALTLDKTDLGIGRFPVTTAEEARIMVDKTIAFLSRSNAGAWKNVVCFLGDDGDENEHMAYSDDVAERVKAANPELEVRKIMWDRYRRVSSLSHNTFPEVTAQIATQMREGALLMNYMGHAAPYVLSHEFAMQLSDFRGYKGECLPLWYTAACDVMPFDSQTENIGETAVLNDGGAAVAFIGTARTVYASNNLQLDRYFSQYIFSQNANGERYRVGDALRLAKNYLISGGVEMSNRENKLHYALLGDPALTLGAPQNRVVLDEINGTSLQGGDAPISLSAGQRVTLSGHVEDAQGAALPSFDGVLTARLYDGEQTYTCMNNAGAREAFTYRDRPNPLFAGQDSVVNGRFTLTFVVPADISYSESNGRVVFYAVDNALQTEANGYNESFRLVAADVASADTIGPEIMPYLGDDEFENGGRVCPSPYLLAVLHDESGINDTGSGLGHDIVLTIDGQADRTYVLNDYFTTEFGDYSRGTIGFSIPRLEDGPHSLTLRAWDMLNNTSTALLDFVVDSRLKPEILHLSCSANPATTSTRFLVSYDRPGSTCHFTIEVFDYAGRRLWRHSQEGSSDTGLYSIPWGLTMPGGGRLVSGVYLYRCILTCDGSEEVSATQKLIIKNNK